MKSYKRLAIAENNCFVESEMFLEVEILGLVLVVGKVDVDSER